LINNFLDKSLKTDEGKNKKIITIKMKKLKIVKNKKIEILVETFIILIIIITNKIIIKNYYGIIFL
jgi:hypothetical protein